MDLGERAGLVCVLCACIISWLLFVWVCLISRHACMHATSAFHGPWWLVCDKAFGQGTQWAESVSFSASLSSLATLDSRSSSAFGFLHVMH